MMVPALAVVVLYRCEAAKSSTLASLRAAQLRGYAPAAILVVDNVPAEGNAQSPAVTDLGACYLPCDENLGVQPAYERARSMAAELGIDWLWLWDQDSEFAPEFVEAMCDALKKVADEPACAGVLPRVLSSSRLASPLIHGAEQPPPGVLSRLPVSAKVQAINSGMLVRRRFVDELGGFDSRFWLDGLDHWLCVSVRNRKCWFAVADAEFEHQLSVFSATAYVSVFRYESILCAEFILFKDFSTPMERLVYFAKLGVRCLKHPLKFRTFDYLLPGLRQMVRICRWVVC